MKRQMTAPRASIAAVSSKSLRLSAVICVGRRTRRRRRIDRRASTKQNALICARVSLATQTAENFFCDVEHNWKFDLIYLLEY